MQITVFGASGKIGSRVVELALERGYKVVASVHTHDMFVPSNNLLVIPGDIYNTDDVAEALRGSTAVISCLSSWGTEYRNVLSSAMRAIITAMTEQDISRIVTLTGTGANVPGKPLSSAQKILFRLLAPFPVGKVFEDGVTHMNLLAESRLEWTTLRSPVMTDIGKKGYRLDLQPGSPLATIHRQAVAAAMLDQLLNSDYLFQAPIIHRK